MKLQPDVGSPPEKKLPPQAFQEGNLISRVPSVGGPPLGLLGADQKVQPGSPPASGAQRWQIRYDELKFEYPALGKGAFGEVFKGTYRKSQVAIKVYDFQGKLALEEKTIQYALWAVDWHMWTMIQKYLPIEAQAQQCQELETQGTVHGKHFSLQGLISALQTYVDNAGKVWNYDRRADDHWQKVVGGEQKLLPVHVVNEYCRPDRAFEPCPSEWEAKLPRTRELEIWDGAQSKYVKGSWFIPSSSKDALGLSYAFLRYSWRLVVGGQALSGVTACRGGGAARLQTSKSPILVEDAHAAIRGSEVSIIVRL